MLGLKIIGALIGIALLLFLGVGTVLYLLQKKFIFYPTKLNADYSFPLLPGHEEVWLDKSPGNELHGLYFKAEQDKGLILFFHGNAGALDKWGHAAAPFLDLGYSVFIYDFRTYGKSGGELSQKRLLDDSLLAYQWALEKYPNSKIGLVGRSLGTGMASWLAKEKEAAFLLLETPYTSLLDMASITFGWFPLRYLLKYRLDNFANLSETRLPTYIIHGTKDLLIPYRMAEKLATLGPELITIENAGHNNIPDFEKYHESIRQILSAHI
ncbi:MAG: alpha/beta fold hydrolase [Saprospiraceae bacterium]|nr:alpha/beta fold hydrolase [Saprospiraceae bacterium]